MLERKKESDGGGAEGANELGTGEPTPIAPSVRQVRNMRDFKLHEWALSRFKNRAKFSFPSFCDSCGCCRKKGGEADKRIRFAKQKLRRELDVARFINQQRETYISYLTNMTSFEQNVCQKLAQITYDADLTSQNSSTDDNAEFIWNKTDQLKLALLFHNEKASSKRLVNILRIQEDCERLSKRRQRQLLSAAAIPLTAKNT